MTLTVALAPEQRREFDATGVAHLGMYLSPGCFGRERGRCSYLPDDLCGPLERQVRVNRTGRVDERQFRASLRGLSAIMLAWA